jgi:hypothetical protein
VQAYVEAEVYSEVEKIYRDLIVREPAGDNAQVDVGRCSLD